MRRTSNQFTKTSTADHEANLRFIACARMAGAEIAAVEK